jgi:hypothetical protein
MKQVRMRLKKANKVLERDTKRVPDGHLFYFPLIPQIFAEIMN